MQTNLLFFAWETIVRLWSNNTGNIVEVQGSYNHNRLYFHFRKCSMCYIGLFAIKKAPIPSWHHSFPKVHIKYLECIGNLYMQHV